MNQQLESRIEEINLKMESVIGKFGALNYEDQLIDQFTNRFQKIFDTKMND